METANCAPAPSPCRNRPATNTGMFGASPATTVPAAKTPSMIANGRIGPTRSTARPVSGMAITVARPAALNARP